MKQIIVYYSHSGNTMALAKEIAAQEGAELAEVKEVKPLRGPGTLFVGCPQAASGKGRPIRPLEADLASYDKIILMAPIWGGCPASPINSVIGLLPSGKEVELRMVSGSGASAGKAKAIARVEAKGCKVTAYVDLKSGK